MSSPLFLLALVGAAVAFDYAPAVKDYGNYGYDHHPKYYGYQPVNKYSYAPYGGYGRNIPAYSPNVPQYGYGNGYEAPSYGFGKYGYETPSYGFGKYGYVAPSYGYGHPSPYGAPRYNAPSPYGFPKGYGSYGKYEAPAYGHPSY